MTTITLTCRLCHKPYVLTVSPDVAQFITPRFKALCNQCADRGAVKLPDREFMKRPDDSRVPYPDP